MSARRRALVALGVAVALLGGGLQAVSAAPPTRTTVPSPTVTGPVPSTQGTQGRPQTDMAFDLAPYGYVEEEFFVSGTARAVTTGAADAPYTTRMLVRRPADAKRFNGTVIVEWNNVTAQHDQSPDWFWSYPMALRDGYAYVIVSAQAAGICCAPPLSLQFIDRLRYAELSHPGDDYSFDIFSQVGRALRAPTGVDALGGLKVKRALATGHSQSASRLYSYVNQVQASARVFDAFLLDGGGAQTYPAEPPAPVVQIREEGLSASPVEPNVSENYRLWEVAGASHTDYWVLRQQFDNPERLVPQSKQFGPGWREREEEVAGNWGYDIEAREGTCALGGGMFPKRYAVSAALKRLDEWVRTGTPAPRVPRLQYTAAGAVARDAFGNGLGGLRLPPVDVPVARYVTDACRLFGNTIPFDPALLRELYPTHEDYVAKVRLATQDAVARGVLLPEDAADLLQRAEASAVPVQRLRSPVPSHLLDLPPVPLGR